MDHLECRATAGGFAALAAACRVDDQVNTAAGIRVENGIMPYRPEPAMAATDRVFINGQHMLKSDAEARLDSIDENIKRHLERARTVSGNLRDIVMDVINRLRAEKQEIAAIIGISSVL